MGGKAQEQLLWMDEKDQSLYTDAGAATSVHFSRVRLPLGLTSTDEMFPVEPPDSG